MLFLYTCPKDGEENTEVKFKISGHFPFNGGLLEDLQFTFEPPTKCTGTFPKRLSFTAPFNWGSGKL